MFAALSVGMRNVLGAAGRDREHRAASSVNAVIADRAHAPGDTAALKRLAVERGAERGQRRGRIAAIGPAGAAAARSTAGAAAAMTIATPRRVITVISNLSQDGNERCRDVRG